MSYNYIEHRDAAIEWMNSKRDFDAGIKVLEASGFRPSVVKNLKRVGVNGPEAPARLVYLMRTLIDAWAQPYEVWEDTDVASGIVDGHKIQPVALDPNLSPAEAYELIQNGELKDIPESIEQLITTYRDAYIIRDMAHKALAELGEENSDEVCKAREQLSNDIARCSAVMDNLYPQFVAFVQNGTLPDSSAEPNNDSSKDSEQAEEQPTDYESMSLDDLKSLKKSLGTKRLRAQNRLDYQQETKADEPNPLPDGAERVKYETKIKNLTLEIEKIKMAIAKRG